jgi:hypothetical protein
MSEQYKITMPMCPRTERHRTANPRPLGQQNDGSWLCGNCGYDEPHKTGYPVSNPVFKQKLARAKSA